LITYHSEKEMQRVTREAEEFEKTICKEKKTKKFF
jgi:hypothetical protein